MQPAGPAVGDRPREQLLDRPVDHRQDHEHDRPAQRDPAVGGRVEHVARGGQVQEREDAGRGDPDRQHPRARGVRELAGRSAPRRYAVLGRAPVRAAAAVAVPPEASRRAPSRDPHQQHRPRERRAHLDHLTVAAATSRTKSRLDQWLTWPGVLPRSRTYAPRATFERPPQRLAGDRDQQVPRGHARHLGQRPLRVGDVLEHLDRGGQVERADPETAGPRRPWSRNSRFGRAAGAPLGLELRVGQVDPEHRLVAELLGPPVGQDALAAARRRAPTAARPA